MSTTEVGPGVHARPAGTAPRSTSRLLRDRDVAALFLGKTFSTFGVWAYGMTLAVAVYDATGSSVAVAVASGAQFVPQVVLSPLAGAWADAGRPRRQMFLGASLMLLAAASMVLWVALFGSEGWRFAWVAIASATVAGVGWIMGGPAMQSVLPRLVAPDELRAAVGLNFAPMTIARIAGPVGGAGLVGLVGVAGAFAMPVVAQVVALLAFAALRVPPSGHGSGGDHSVRAAGRFALRNRRVLALLLVAAATGFAAEPSLTLAPALSDSLGGGSGLAGVLSAGFGVGAALALATLGTRVGRYLDERRGPLVGLSLMCAGLLVSAALPTTATAVVGFAVTGAGFSVALSTITAALLLETPGELRGRVMAFWMMAFTGARPVAGLVCGGVTDLVSVEVALAATGVVAASGLLVRSRLRS